MQAVLRFSWASCVDYNTGRYYSKNLTFCIKPPEGRVWIRRPQPALSQRCEERLQVFVSQDCHAWKKLCRDWRDLASCRVRVSPYLRGLQRHFLTLIGIRAHRRLPGKHSNIRRPPRDLSAL